MLGQCMLILQAARRGALRQLLYRSAKPVLVINVITSVYQLLYGNRRWDSCRYVGIVFDVCLPNVVSMRLLSTLWASPTKLQ